MLLKFKYISVTGIFITLTIVAIIVAWFLTGFSIVENGIRALYYIGGIMVLLLAAEEGKNDAFIPFRFFMVMLSLFFILFVFIRYGIRFSGY